MNLKKLAKEAFEISQKRIKEGVVVQSGQLERFLKNKLSPADYKTAIELLDKVIDAAENQQLSRFP